MIDEHQDIGDADNHHQHVNNENEAQNYDATGAPRYIPLCDQPAGKVVDIRELDPKYYQFVPACWTQRIRPAGR